MADATAELTRTTEATRFQLGSRASKSRRMAEGKTSLVW